MNNEIIIYSSSGTPMLSVPITSESKCAFELMSEDYVELKFSLLDPVIIGMGCYVVWRGKRYEIVDLQKPADNATTGGYDYTFKFEAYYRKWKNKIFKYTPEMGGQEASWNLTAMLSVQLSVFLRNLVALGYDYNGVPFVFEIDDSVDDTAELMSYSDTNMIDALSDMAETWDCEYWVLDNVIHFGKCETGTTMWEMSKETNVESVSVSDSSETYATRIYAFGAARNIPTNYRPIDESLVVNGVVEKHLLLPEGTPYVDAYEDMTTEEAVEAVVVFDEVYPRTDGHIATITTKTYTDTSVDENNEEIEEEWDAYRFTDDGFKFSEDYILSGTELQVKFTSGSLNGMTFSVLFNPDEYNEDSDEGQLYEIVRNEDYGRPLPDAVLYPKVGDTYVLIGWDSTKMADLGLIAKAEQELLEEAKEYVEKTKIDPSTYALTMMSNWVYEQGKTNDDDFEIPFSVGDKVKFYNNAYFKEGYRESRIIGYEYKMDIPFDSPVLTIGESVAYSRLKDLEDSVEELTLAGTTYQSAGTTSGTTIYLITTSDKTTPTNKNTYSALRMVQEFASKTSDDSFAGVMTFLKGLLSNGVTSSVFSSGVLGSGFRLLFDVLTGESSLEVDNLLVRRIATFVEILIKKLQHIGGELVLSPASMSCTSVEEYDDYYRCYFLHESDGKVISNDFIIGDMARSQTFNEANGNAYYWRAIVGIGDDYIDVSKEDCDEGSTIPMAGDDIVQLGNKTDASRQNAIILSTIGDDAPSIKQYTGIDNYSLVGKEVTILSPKGNKMTGSFYGASSDGEESMELSGLIGDVKRDINSLSVNVDDVKNDVSSLVDDVDDIKSQTDREFTIWFYNYVPSASNEPELSWTTDELKATHEQDIFYNRDAGYAWRYVLNEETNTYEWQDIVDQDTLRALEKAASAEKLSISAESVAKEAQGLAKSAYDGIGLTEEDLESGKTAVSYADGLFLAMSKRFTYDDDGNINGVAGGGLLSTSDFNTLFDKKISMDSDGNVTNISKSGLVTTSNYSSLFAENVESNGLIKRSEIFVSEDSVKIKSDLISLEGYTTINNGFSIDMDGSFKAVSGKIGAFELTTDGNLLFVAGDGDGYTNTRLSSDGFATGVNGGAAYIGGMASTGTDIYAVKIDGTKYDVGIYSKVFHGRSFFEEMQIASYFSADTIALAAVDGDVLLRPDVDHKTEIYGLTLHVVKVDANYTIRQNDDVIHVSSANAVTITLPSGIDAGKIIFVKSYSSGGVVVSTPDEDVAIVSAGSRKSVTSVDVNNNSAIFIKIDDTYWVHYNCN